MTTKSEAEMSPTGRVFWRNKALIIYVAVMVTLNVLLTIYFGKG